MLLGHVLGKFEGVFGPGVDQGHGGIKLHLAGGAFVEGEGGEVVFATDAEGATDDVLDFARDAVVAVEEDGIFDQRGQVCLHGLEDGGSLARAIMREQNYKCGWE